MKATGADLTATDQIASGKESIIDRVGKSKVGKAKVGAKTAKSKSQDKSKGKNLAKFKALTQNSKSGFLTPRARQTFTKLRQAFIKALILDHFDPDCDIQTEINISSYAISGVFSQLIWDNLGQWHPVIFFFRKKIPVET